MFISEEFWFDGVFSKDMSILLVTTESEIINNYGFIYSKELESDKTLNNNPYYKIGEENVEDITLYFCLANMNGQSYVWDDFTLERIYDWLVQKDFKPFISKDNPELTYYLKAKKVTRKFTKDMKGYLEIVFQPYTNYAYVDFNKPIKVSRPIEIKINNKSNIEDEYCFPVFEIENLGNEDIVIGNTSLDSEPLVITGLDLNEKIYVDNLLYVVQTDEGLNRFDCCNRNWIKLKKGNNILKLTGNFNITISAKFPIKG